MKLMEKTWSDDRLDDLSRGVERIDAKVDAGFERMEDRFDALHRLGHRMSFGAVLVLAGYIGAHNLL